MQGAINKEHSDNKEPLEIKNMVVERKTSNIKTGRKNGRFQK
jgi:hypothetical protein